MALFSPLDLLSVSNTEQDIIRCLVRRPRLPAVEIARLTKIPIEELESLLKKMVSDARLTEQDNGGHAVFDVSIGSKRSPERPTNSLLDSLFGK